MTNDTLTVALALAAGGMMGLVGAFALMKRVILAGDVISHVALPGLGLAFLYSINPLIGGAATLLLGTVLIWHLEKKTGLSTETAIGVIFSFSVAVGALVTPKEDLIEALFGGLWNPTALEFTVGLAAIAVIAWFLVAFKDKLILTLFSSDLAAATGVRVERTNLYFLLVFALAVLLGLRFLGALLVGALIIVPAAIGRQLTHTLGGFLLTSALASVVSVGVGFALAEAYRLPLGPAIVAVAAALFGLSLLKKKV